MKDLYFAHANGFPSKSYQCLFDYFDADSINYIDILGKGDIPLNENMYNFAKEITLDIESKHNQPVIGLGHSAGAVALMLAASERPDLFESLILMEPVIFNPLKRFAIDVIRSIGLGNSIAPVKKALSRKNHFDSLQQAEEYFSNKRFFKAFCPSCFQNYLLAALIPSVNGGVELKIAPKEEAEVFRSVHTKINHRMKQLSGLYLYGNSSEMLKKADLNWWKNNFKNFEMKSIDGSHVFPLEHPKATALIINDFLHR